MATPINKPVKPGAGLGIEAARRKSLIPTKQVYADVPVVGKPGKSQPSLAQALTQSEQVRRDRVAQEKALKKEVGGR